MEIRIFEKADEDDVVELWDAAGLNINPLNNPRADIELCRTSGHGEVLVGVEGKDIVASVMVGHDGHRGWYYYLATHPEHQRKGYGRAMVEAAEDWLRRRGLPKVEILVRDINQDVLDFYDRIGYVHEPVKTLSKRLDGREHVPVGQTVETIVTSLEMTEAPDSAPVQPPTDKLMLVRAHDIGLDFYRYIYSAVGDAWSWTDRKRLSDEELAAILGDEMVEVYILYVDGEPAGFAELDRRSGNDIELAYFGIVTRFIGRKLGPYLLDWAIRQAWSYGPDRFWLHTCTLDHPKALATYQKAGFTPYKQETHRQVLS